MRLAIKHSIGRLQKLDVNVAEDRRVAFTLPEDFPPGPAEVIVLAATAVPPTERGRVRVLGSLASAAPPPLDVDPLADALADVRGARNPG
ncbi:hypothetical protein BE20_50455 [Sorangium cellulosum]|uniref:Uncharacterized protein n=1 Tax=Sorangium cellulosum TaxID=56 RepID=A0A150TD83_SORCE|nr:hypothetical protein BE18_15600 [Sorangium cellulosum]KYG02537.1 hypothetical protein BE20_50455 [Sorangium cellulosum]